MPKNPPNLPWVNDNPDDPNYEWPVVDAPSPGAVHRIMGDAEEQGGRGIRESHADRFVTMKQPSADGEQMVNRKVARCECRRRALVSLPTRAGDPIRVCVICDSVHHWPLVGMQSA